MEKRLFIYLIGLSTALINPLCHPMEGVQTELVHKSHFEELPLELKAHIFKYLIDQPSIDLLNTLYHLSLVNREFRNLLKNPEFLHSAFQNVPLITTQTVIFSLSSLEERYKTVHFHSLLTACATIRDSDDKTPLHWATKECEADAVRELLAHGAKVSARDKQGFTPLHAAAYCMSPETADLLITHSADVNAQNNQEQATPLHRAAFFGNWKIAKHLLEQGALVNAQNSNGNTALHELVGLAHTIGEQRALETLKILLQFHANLRLKNLQCRTPLDLAKKIDERLPEEPPSALTRLLKEHCKP
jgi:Ankyrin repeats (3 copies)/Ankyrin repeat